MGHVPGNDDGSSGNSHRGRRIQSTFLEVLMEFVDVRKAGALAWVTITREAKLNALNAQVVDDLETAFTDLHSDDSIRAVVITGQGEKSFVAGADISQFPELSPDEALAFSKRGQSVFNLIEATPKPVMAAVNGFALGGGCELALACHLRYAADTASFGQPEVKLGVIAGYGGTQRLPRLIGNGRALDLLLSGRMIKAQEALEMGLVNGVFPAADLLAEVEKIAGVLLQQGPQAQRYTLAAVLEGAGQHIANGLDVEAAAFEDVFRTTDRVEGARAFLERRAPEFKNQ
jgi:enoyl-CoA hydratase